MASVRARPRLRGQPGGLRDGVIGGVAGDQCQPEETDGAVIINVGSADLEEMSVGQLRGDEIRTAEVWLGSAVTCRRQREQSLAGQGRGVVEPPAGPGANEGQVSRCTCQPFGRLAKVRFRRSLTFAGAS
jgi:hypothetical protein